MPAPSSARVQLIAAAVLFSTGGAAIKAAAFTGWQVASFRSGIAAVAIWCISAPARRRWTWQAGLVGVAYAACLVLFALANRLTTAANTIFLQSTAPLYLLVLGPWLLQEPVRRRDLGFMLAVGFGLCLFFVGVEHPAATAPDPRRGNWLALGSGFFWALTITGFRWLGGPARAGARGRPELVVVSGNLTAFLVTLPFALPIGSHPPGDWGVILYLGVFQIGLAYVFVTSAIRRVPALEAALILLLEPVLNPVWAWLVHGETPSVSALIGGAIILGATTLKSRAERTVAAPAT